MPGLEADCATVLADDCELAGLAPAVQVISHCGRSVAVGAIMARLHHRFRIESEREYVGRRERQSIAAT